MILGIGTDLVEIKRIQGVGVDRLAQRILTEKELQTLSLSSHRKLEMVAGRFVAKEAISKALGCGIGKTFSFYDAEIICDNQGKPYGYVSSGVLQKLDIERQIRVHISITHSRGMASAVAVIEQI